MNATPPGLPFDPNALDNRYFAYIERVCRILERTVVPYHRAKTMGVDKVPDGAGLLVGNHSGGSMLLDAHTFAVAFVETRGSADLPYALAHDMVVHTKLGNRLMVPLGAVRATPENAAARRRRPTESTSRTARARSRARCSAR